jgi:hypothetical protein
LLGAEAFEQSARLVADVLDRPTGIDAVQQAEARVMVDHRRRAPVILLEPPADGGAIIVVAPVDATGDPLDHDLVGCVGAWSTSATGAPAMSRTDTVVRVISASPDRVFAALTDPDAPAGPA